MPLDRLLKGCIKSFRLEMATGVIGLALLETAWALDPTKAITQYHQDVWTERDGLPQGSVQAITQTRDGYLWIGTRDGLARFDGVTFTVFRSENFPGLESNDIRALLEDREGHLWVGTFNGGVSRFQDGKFTSVTAVQNLPGNGVLDIFEDRQGSLWMGTWNGIARFAEGKFVTYTHADGLAGRSARAICEDRDGALWIATGSGLSRFADGHFRTYSTRDGLPNNLLREVYVDHDGALWIGGIGGGLAKFCDEKFTTFTTGDGLADNRVRTTLQDRDGNLWVGTWNGLSRFQHGTITSYKKEDGLPQDLVEALFEDREGSLWIGTNGGGLVRLRDGKFAIYTTKEGLVSNQAKCVFQARDGTLWIGSDGGGLSRYRDGQFINYTAKDGLLSNAVRSIGEDREGNIWIGIGRPAGLCLFKDGKFIPFTREQGLAIEDGPRAIFGDREGTLWIGTDGSGLWRYRDGMFKAFSSRDGLLSDLIRVVGQDREGNLWIGTNGGLCRYRRGEFTGFTVKDGLSHNAVYSFHEDADGNLWFGTQGGLTRYNGERFTPYTTRDGLFQSIIYQVLEDDDRNLWMSGNRGVFRLAKQALEDFDAGKIRTLPCAPYGISDGMKTTQCAGGSQPAGWRTSDGRLWFPTVQGVAMINPRHVPENLQSPPVLIEQITVGNQRLDSRRPAKLPPSARELKFQYTALSFVAPEKVRFKYKLEGLDRDWIEAETRRMAFYNEVPPGQYSFRVQACNNDGVWNEAGASFAFTQAPHFYRTVWFYALCPAVVGLAAWSFHRRKLRQAEAQFSLVLAERNRIARDLHDTLAQGFAGIAFQLEAVAAKLTEAPAHAGKHLQLALNMVRHSLAEARRSVLNLRSSALEKGDLANALLETARQTMADKPIELQLETLGTVRALPAKVENHLLRIGQEAITNSLKHSGAEKIRIELDYRPGTVALRVRDDGNGFDSTTALSSDGTHFGLLGMRERAKQMGARLGVKSGPGQGTEVEVEVPVT
jgi:ligand-binding sensor domain-containing protein/signal transduction histidine kinase